MREAGGRQGLLVAGGRAVSCMFFPRAALRCPVGKHDQPHLLGYFCALVGLYPSRGRSLLDQEHLILDPNRPQSSVASLREILLQSFPSSPITPFGDDPV